MEKPKLLIVDDNKVIADSLAQRTVDGGFFEPVTVYSYTEMSLLLQDEQVFFAGVIDLVLPDCKDGDAVLLSLSAQIPTIVLTASLDEPLRNKIVRLPIVDFISKESRDDILSAVSVAEDILKFKGMKVLITDNSPTRTKYLSHFFKLLLFDVISTESASEAVEMLKNTEGIEIVTINNERSDISGPQFIKTVRQDPQIRRCAKFRSIVIFGVSSESTDFIRSRFIKNGANDLLSLPISKEEFNSKVINAMSMKNLVFELAKKNEELTATVKVLEEYNKAVDAGGIVSKGDLEGNITYANDAFCCLTGYSKEELLGKPHNILRHPNTPKSVFKEMWDTIQKGRIWIGNVKNVRKDGSVYYVATTVVPIMNRDNIIIEYVAIRQDITELVKTREELKHQFQTDSLTSLGSRARLIMDIRSAVSPMIAVFDVDRFKEINGFYGHGIGDLVLKELGTRLFDWFSDSIFEVYRTNADQYAVLTSSQYINTQTFAGKVKSFQNNLKSNSLHFNEVEIDVSMSACLVDEENDILVKADIGLKNTKNLKKDFTVYDDSEIQKSQVYKNNIMWAKVIKEALKDDLVTPFFQPIVNNNTGKIEKYEALVRIIYKGKVITPQFFLDIAKKTRYYPLLTDSVVKKSIELFSKNRNIVTINLSVEDISNEETVSNIYELLDAYRIGDRIAFEIVESEGIENYEQVETFISNVKRKGCNVAIDDFGAGYSNFEYLMKLKADYIKIDGSIIKNICTDDGAASITEAIVSFAKKNGMKTVAEFVSSDEIYQKVKQFGVDYSQGYLFGKPEPFLLK